MSLDSILRSNPNKVTIPYSGKNLITYPYFNSTITQSGITYTVNSDGSIKVSGKNDTKNNSVFYIISNNNPLTLEKSKQYTLSGGIAGAGVTFNLQDLSFHQTVGVSSTSGPKTFTTSYNDYYMWLVVLKGTTVDTTVYPQLEKGMSATDYSLNTGDKDVEKVSYGSKNLLPHSTAATVTTTGITFTNNSDGTIKANGTATANATYNLGTFTIPKDKTLTLSGCPENGSASTYYLYAYDTVNNKTYTDIGNGVTFDHSNNSINIYIRVQNNTTVNNLLFKPQLEFGAKKTDWVDYSREIVWTKTNT